MRAGQRATLLVAGVLLVQCCYAASIQERGQAEVQAVIAKRYEGLDEDFYAEGGFVEFDRKTKEPMPDTRGDWPSLEEERESAANDRGWFDPRFSRRWDTSKEEQEQAKQAPKKSQTWPKEPSPEDPTSQLPTAPVNPQTPPAAPAPAQVPPATPPATPPTVPGPGPDPHPPTPDVPLPGKPDLPTPDVPLPGKPDVPDIPTPDPIPTPVAPTPTPATPTPPPTTPVPTPTTPPTGPLDKEPPHFVKPPVNQLADDGEKMDLDKDFYAEGGFVKFDRKMEGPVPDTRASWPSLEEERESAANDRGWFDPRFSRRWDANRQDLAAGAPVPKEVKKP